MVYTAYKSSEYKELNSFYKKKVVGVSDGNEVLQVPKCPECGGDMFEVEGMTDYLSCVDCGCCRLKLILKE